MTTEKTTTRRRKKKADADVTDETIDHAEDAAGASDSREDTDETETESMSSEDNVSKKDDEMIEDDVVSEDPPANDDVEKRAPKITGAAKPLALKMARVMAEVSHVPKNGRNDFHGYDYIMESDLVDLLRGKLAAQGVAIFPSIREHVVSQTQDTRGRTQYMATVTLDVTFIDGDSGDQMTTTWVGQGVDTGDKSYYKAYTGAFKYALLKTFLISGEDDGSNDIRAPRQNRGGRGNGRGSGGRRAGGRR